MARAALNWSLQQLADAAGAHRNTIHNFEAGRFAGDETTLTKIRNVLETAGVVFIPEGGTSDAIFEKLPDSLRTTRHLMAIADTDQAKIVADIRTALEAAGIDLISKSDGAGGVVLRRVGIEKEPHTAN